MNKFTLLMVSTIFTSAIFSTFTAAAGNYKFIAGDSSNTTKLCIAAVSNDLADTKRHIKKIGVAGRTDLTSSKLAIRTVLCNNKDLVQFTAQYDADKTFNYLNRRAPKKYKLKDDDIKIIDLASNKFPNSDKTIMVIVTSR